MVRFNFNVGAEVYCKDGQCGRLVKVVMDPPTHEVTGLIVEKSSPSKENWVLPVSVVKDVGEQDIHLSITSEEFDYYRQYQPTEFEEPGPDWEEDKQYPTEQVTLWPHS